MAVWIRMPRLMSWLVPTPRFSSFTSMSASTTSSEPIKRLTQRQPRRLPSIVPDARDTSNARDSATFQSPCLVAAASLFSMSQYCFE